MEFLSNWSRGWSEPSALVSLQRAACEASMYTLGPSDGHLLGLETDRKGCAIHTSCIKSSLFNSFVTVGKLLTYLCLTSLWKWRSY